MTISINYFKPVCWVSCLIYYAACCYAEYSKAEGHNAEYCEVNILGNRGQPSEWGTPECQFVGFLPFSVILGRTNIFWSAKHSSLWRWCPGWVTFVRSDICMNDICAMWAWGRERDGGSWQAGLAPDRLKPLCANVVRAKWLQPIWS